MLSDRDDEIKKAIRCYSGSFKSIFNRTFYNLCRRIFARSTTFIPQNYRSLFYIKQIINLIAINANRVEQVNDLIARQSKSIVTQERVKRRSFVNFKRT